MDLTGLSYYSRPVYSQLKITKFSPSFANNRFVLNHRFMVAFRPEIIMQNTVSRTPDVRSRLPYFQLWFICCKKRCVLIGCRLSQYFEFVCATGSVLFVLCTSVQPSNVPFPTNSYLRDRPRYLCSHCGVSVESRISAVDSAKLIARNKIIY